jgi:hypothetical protein
MKGLVWALYLMVQDPGASATSWAYTGVTYLNKQSCVSDAATFTKMPIGSKADGVDPKSSIAYVCVLQPKPEHYKG